jgi:argininosuccinate lyase
MHLSRFAEEIVIWCSDGFGFMALSDAFTTGNSIMPQAQSRCGELVRAKTGRLNGSLIALLTAMKALPLAYSKDMQEDKVPVFEAADALDLCLAATAGMVRDLRPDRERLRAAAERGFGTATDLADWLVRVAGLPFRRAHQVTGSIVKRAEASKLHPAELPPRDAGRRAHDHRRGLRDTRPRPFSGEPQELRGHGPGVCSSCHR